MFYEYFLLPPPITVQNFYCLTTSPSLSPFVQETCERKQCSFLLCAKDHDLSVSLFEPCHLNPLVLLPLTLVIAGLCTKTDAIKVFRHQIAPSISGNQAFKYPVFQYLKILAQVKPLAQVCAVSYQFSDCTSTVCQDQ